MKQHICLICLGSNTNREQNILFAQKELKRYFETITFSKEQDTAPLFYTNRARFTNQVASISTPLSIEEITTIFKRIEAYVGRLPQDKTNEIVKLDIDLLTYDELVLKEKDLKREYIIVGINELKTKESVSRY